MLHQSVFQTKEGVIDKQSSYFPLPESITLQALPGQKHDKAVKQTNHANSHDYN